MPWTDWKGLNEEYAEEVKPCSAFHDVVPETNFNKLDKKLRGTLFSSHCYGRANDLVTFVAQEKLSEYEGWKAVVNAIDKIDTL